MLGDIEAKLLDDGERGNSDETELQADVEGVGPPRVYA